MYSTSTSMLPIPRWPRYLMALTAVSGAALVYLGCLGNAQCDSLRTSYLDELQSWSTCNGPDECVVIQGNTNDCTGVFSCNFPVQFQWQDVARRRTILASQDSQVCIRTCGGPTCAGGQPYCDLATKRCRLRETGGSSTVTPAPPPSDGGPE